MFRKSKKQRIGQERKKKKKKYKVTLIKLKRCNLTIYKDSVRIKENNIYCLGPMVFVNWRFVPTLNQFLSVSKDIWLRKTTQKY